MSSSLLRTFVIAALSLSIAMPVIAGPRAGDAATLTPQARGDLTRAFVSKWGDYVQRVYKVPVGVWAKRMVPNFVAADPTNFRNAMKRETFEGALSELNGTGHRLPDQKVIDQFARNAPRALTTKTAGEIGAKTLGSTTRDMVFTPITPCRILDTRVVGGPITANTFRRFIAVSNGDNFAAQGGSSTDCGMNQPVVSGVVLNVTAVTPSGAGFATVYKSEDPQPLAASLNYTAGAIVNNSVVVGVKVPLDLSDFTIYTFAQSHFVVDIVGYFSSPQATQLQCVSTSTISANVPAGGSTISQPPLCPSGYDVVTPFCFGSPGVNLRGSGVTNNEVGLSAFCAWHNPTASAQSVQYASTCCRVPGH
jgi:hypothetical protein